MSEKLVERLSVVVRFSLVEDGWLSLNHMLQLRATEF